MAREFRVYGPPGTGKTTWINAQAKAAMKKYGHNGVVIASLTRAAAHEIAGRDSQVPPQNVGTLHAHAFRALSRPHLAETKDGLTAWNEHVEKISPRYKINSKNTVDPENAALEAVVTATEGESLLAELQMRRARMQAQEFWPSRVRHFSELWEAWKARSGYVDFTDLIERALEEQDAHPSRPMAFFLDEAQDMSRLELALARKWGEKCDVFVIVGDPYQNLYEWRGSEPDAFTAHDAEDVKVLSQSYRVSKAVHSYAVQWAQQIKGMEFPSYMPTDQEGVLLHKDHSWSYPQTLMRDIAQDVADGMSVMVLTTCGYMLAPIITQLREDGTPFHNPYRVTHGGWNPLRGAARIDAFLTPTMDGRLWTWQEIDQWIEPLTAQGVLERGAKSWIENRAMRGKFDRAEDDVPIDKPSDILNLFTNDEHRTAVMDGDLGWYIENTRASRKRSLLYPVAVAKNRGPQALREKPRIIVGTIHSVKGGEADSVYVFPDMSTQGMKAHRLNKDATVRQFYVAFTRARTKLTLCESSGQGAVRFPKGSS